MRLPRQVYCALLLVLVVRVQTFAMPVDNDIHPAGEGMKTVWEMRTGTDLTLEKVLGATLRNSLSLNAANLDTCADRAALDQAAARPNPELALDIENVGVRDDYRGFNSAEATVQLGWTLETCGKRRKRVLAARGEALAATTRRSILRREVLAQATQAYIDVLGGQEELALNRQRLELERAVLDTLETWLVKGEADPVEVQQARIEAVQQRCGLKRAELSLCCARRRLASFWGDSLAVFGQALGDLATPLVLPDWDRLCLRLSASPEMLLCESESNLLAARLELEKSLAVPDIGLAAGGRRIQGDRAQTLVASISLPLPIFDRNRAGVQRARCDMAAARLRQADTGLRLAAESAQALADLTTAQDEIEAFHREIIPGVEAYLASLEKEYPQGACDFLQLQQARRMLLEARAGLLETRLRQRRAQVELERLVGWLEGTPEWAFLAKKEALR